MLNSYSSTFDCDNFHQITVGCQPEMLLLESYFPPPAPKC